MDKVRPAVKAVHRAYAAGLFILAIYVLFFLAATKPSDEPWPVTAEGVFVPIALLLAGLSGVILLGLRAWSRTGGRALIFIADMAFPVLALGIMGPVLVIEPGNPASLVVGLFVAVGLICGGLIAASKRGLPVI